MPSTLMASLGSQHSCSYPRQISEIRFQHDYERYVFEILRFYGLNCEYEAVCFPLKWYESTEGGRTKRIIKEAFTPDIYITESGIFIELTALQQRLMTGKRAKIRRMKELYPDVTVYLWNRNDIETFLMHKSPEKAAEFSRFLEELENAA